MTQDEIRKIIEETPGILQSELNKHTDMSQNAIQDCVMGLYKKREIYKIKYKLTNKLYIS